MLLTLEKHIIEADNVSMDGDNLQILMFKTKRFVNFVEDCGWKEELKWRKKVLFLGDTTFCCHCTIPVGGRERVLAHYRL